MSYQNDVADFMKAGEQPVRSELSLEGDQTILYMNLISCLLYTSDAADD